MNTTARVFILSAVTLFAAPIHASAEDLGIARGFGSHLTQMQPHFFHSDSAIATARHGLVEICVGPRKKSELQRTLKLPRLFARRLVRLGLASQGPCEVRGEFIDEVAAARITASEDAEDLNIILLPDTGPDLPIDDVTSIPPEPRVMGQCIDQAYTLEEEVGYAYAVVKDGLLAFANSGGWARAPWETNSPSVPMSEDKPMTIASVSKPVTAVAMMKMLEQEPGIDLDDPFYPLIENKFSGLYTFSDGVIVEIPGAGVEQVTIRNLLMHRSGLKPGLGCGFQNLAKLLAIGVVGTPGSTYDYENSNFCLLREVIEEVTGLDYIDYVEANVLDPMGIVEMSCEREDVDPTLYYNTVGDPGFLFGDYASTCSAYGWHASARNLAQFLANVRQNTVLSPQSTDEMLNACPGANGYCLGWIRTDGSIGVHHWHNGDWIDGNPCETPGSPGDLTQQPSDCKRGYNGTIMQLPLGIDAVLLVNTRGGTGFNPGLKSEVSILRECFGEAFLDANDVTIP